ncbi:GNAT family N-acetyltransferase [Aliiroseovarius sp. S1339]|uniref:GNAT family N-acetyltransferase n=1 Tax=Aliiroseovarius sp. S1339 TaxID=2936990 RepID=UPI0020BE77F8|nr:GNAT family N-acetyltransferase [Aliiroseovarius sp. S1339]MCK8463579.1 GNAT family N-acetyltransferase [Aliiroseovarius sp. S1339]
MIQTARLRLRPAVPEDLADLHDVFSHPSAMRFWSHETHTDLAQTQGTLDGMIASHSETGLELVIELDGKVIGKAGLWRMAEVGYILHPDHWGKGLAQEALQAVIDAAWTKHSDVTEITAEIDPRNSGSVKLLNRLGFVLSKTATRTLFIYDEWCDSAYYVLPRPKR